MSFPWSSSGVAVIENNCVKINFVFLKIVTYFAVIWSMCCISNWQLALVTFLLVISQHYAVLFLMVTHFAHYQK